MAAPRLGHRRSAGDVGAARGILFAIEGALVTVLFGRLRASSPLPLASGSERPAPAREGEPELETLNRLGLALAGHLDMERLVRAVTDAGVAITGAAFGAFLYKDGSDRAAHYVAGAPAEAFVDFPLFQEPNAFGSPFLGAVSRSDDLERDLRYGQNLPFKQMPAGTLPARSHLDAGGLGLASLRHHPTAGPGEALR